MFRLKSFLAGILIVVFAVSCLDDPDCINRNNNLLHITFKNRDGANINVAFDSVMVSGTDSVFYRNTSLGSMVLGLNYFSDETFVTFDIPGDTLQFKVAYNTQTQYVSEECGERYIISSLRITDHPFDSIRIVNAFAAKDSTTNSLEIYIF